MSDSKNFESDLARASECWREIMRPHREAFGVVAFPSAIPLVQGNILPTARLFAHRGELVAALPTGGIAGEIGVQAGIFSKIILERNKPALLHLFDLDFAMHKVEERFLSELERGIVRFHHGDAANNLQHFDNEYFDWLYIDANHSYPDVQRDATIAAQKIKGNGILIFNDYIYWSHCECERYGVVQVVNEMCATGEWKISAFAFHQSMYCDISIVRAP